MKKGKLLVFLLVAFFLVGAGWWGWQKKKASYSPPPAQCQIAQMVYYYLPACPWCQRVKREGTIERLEELGVRVKKINAAVGPIRHQFRGVPTFVIGEKVYSGYKTFAELKELLGCEG